MGTPKQPKKPIPTGLLISLAAVAVIVACLTILVPRLGNGSQGDAANQQAGAAEQVTVQALSLGSGNHSILSFKETRVIAASPADARQVANYLSDQLGTDMGDSYLGIPSARQSDGRTAYVFPQMIDGVPIYGREAVLTVDDDGYAVAMTASLGDYTSVPELESEISDDDALAKVEEAEPGMNIKLLGLYLLLLDESYEKAYLFDVSDPEVDESLIYALSVEDGEVLGTIEDAQNEGDAKVDETYDERLQNLIEMLKAEELEGDAFSEDEAKSLIDEAYLSLPAESDYDMLIGMLRLLASDLDEGKAKRLGLALEKDGTVGLEAQEADATVFPARFVETEQDVEETAAEEEESDKQEEASSETEDLRYTYLHDGFDFVMPEAWRDKVIVIDANDSSNGWLQIMGNATDPYPIVQMRIAEQTISDFGQTYDTESYYRMAVGNSNGVETVNKDGNTLLIFKMQRQDLDGCLVGPFGRSVLIEATVAGEWNAGTQSLGVDEGRARVAALLVDGAESMDAESLDIALIKAIADGIVFHEKRI